MAAASGYDSTVAFQASAVLDGTNWENTYTFTLSMPGNGTMVAVASKDGVPVLTNVSPLTISDGEFMAVLDFSALAITNRGTFYRLASP